MSHEYAAIAHTVGKVLKQKLKRPESEPLPDELTALARRLAYDRRIDVQKGHRPERLMATKTPKLNP